MGFTFFHARTPKSSLDQSIETYGNLIDKINEINATLLKDTLVTNKMSSSSKTDLIQLKEHLSKQLIRNSSVADAEGHRDLTDTQEVALEDLYLNHMELI